MLYNCLSTVGYFSKEPIPHSYSILILMYSRLPFSIVTAIVNKQNDVYRHESFLFRYDCKSFRLIIYVYGIVDYR